MIQQTDIHQFQRPLNTHSDLTIGLTGLRLPGGMVMCQHGSCCVIPETGFHHFAGMDLRMVDGAGEEGFVGYQAMLVIKKEDGKFFPLQ